MPSQDREKTLNFIKVQKPVAEPAKQENQDKINSQALSDVRMGGGGGGKLIGDASNNGKTHSTYQEGYKADCSWPDVKKKHRLSQ